jgi:aspartate kinase
MQKCEVLKIGGGILKDNDCLEKVVRIVREKRDAGKQIVVVQSALYGVTDFLIESISSCIHDEKQIPETLESLKQMHYRYINQLNNASVKEKAKQKIEENLVILEKFLYGIHYLREISPRSKDMIQSFGERLSPIVLEAFLQDNSIPAEFIGAEEAGIIAKGEFENAVVEMGLTAKNINSKVKNALNEKVVLLPGYYGIDENNDVKTFGRGGTDYTAGFISNMLDAQIQIWKDVSGFMSADPKAVKEAKQIERLSYDEAEELGHLGAKILHPKTIQPLREKGLQAEIKNLFEPEKKGTIIGKEGHKKKAIVKSIAARKEVVALTIKSSSMVNTPGFASKVFSKMAEGSIPVGLISTSETAISFTIEPKNFNRAVALLKTLEKEFPNKISTQEHLSLVGIVGEGMKETPGIAAKIFTALAKENINVELISQGASEINVSIVVNKGSLEKAVRTIHKEFVGDKK